MITNWKGPGLVAAGLVLALLVGGCQDGQPRMMQTGTVDTTSILRYDDDYQKVAQEYVKERMDLTRQLGKAVRSGGGELTPETYDKFREKEAELSAKWMKKTREFVKIRVEKISAAAEKVAQEKGLDLVILDSDEMPTVEYGGIDITADVLGEMPGMVGGAGEQKPAGEAK